LRLNPGSADGRVFEDQVGGLGGYLTHFGDDGAEAPVVGDPFLVEASLVLA